MVVCRVHDTEKEGSSAQGQNTLGAGSYAFNSGWRGIICNANNMGVNVERSIPKEKIYPDTGMVQPVQSSSLGEVSIYNIRTDVEDPNPPDAMTAMVRPLYRNSKRTRLVN